MSEVPYPFPKSPANDVGQRSKPASIARGLGWYSLALGAAQLLAPDSVARAAGVRTSSTLMRLYGLREIACGVGILMSRNPAPFLWARVAGDALDIATLAAAPDKNSARALGAFLNVAGVTALDVHAATSLSSSAEDERRKAQNRTQRFASLYRNRSGFSRSPEAMRGAALRDFEMPRDMRAPDAMLPYTHPQRTSAKGA